MSPDPQPAGGAAAPRAEAAAARPRRPRRRAQVPRPTTCATCSSARARARRPRGWPRAASRGRFCGAVGIEVRSHVIRIGSAAVATPSAVAWETLDAVEESPVRCARRRRRPRRMIAEIDRRQEGRRHASAASSRCVARGVPPGLGHVRALGPPARRAPRPGPDVDPGREGGRARRRLPRRRARPGPRFHDEILLDDEHGLHRPTNRAGGLEGGITNGEELRAQAVVKPIPTLLHAARSVDLRTKEPQQASVERSDTCVVPAAGVVARRWWPGCSPMPCSRSSAATRSPSCSSTSKRRGAVARVPRPAAPSCRSRGEPPGTMKSTTVAAAWHPTHREIRPPDAAQAFRRRCARSTARSASSCDDMVETMYAAPGIGLAAPQIAVPLRVIVIDLSVGDEPDQLIKLVNPEFVEQAGRAAPRRGLPLRARVRRLAGAARARRREAASTPTARSADLRRHRSSWPAPSATRSTTSTACSSSTG